MSEISFRRSLTTAVWMVWGAIASAQIASLSIDSPRRAFYRGEEILLVIRCDGGGPIADGSKLEVSLGGVVRATRDIQSLAATRAFRFPALALKVGTYQLEVALHAPDGTTTKITEPLTIGQRPNPERLPIWLWGGGGNQWYVDHGFTTWTGLYHRGAGGAFTEADGRALDQALPSGAAVGIFPNGGLRDIDPAQFDDPDAKNIGVRPDLNETIANPFHPEVARLQDESNRALMEFVRKYPQVQTAFFNTEVVDSLRINRNETGQRLMKEELGFTEQAASPPQFVAPGVIADDDPSYLLHKFRYKRGDGLAVANKRVVDMIHRYRPDIVTITDPYRETTLLDMMSHVDVVGTWTYTNPDPKLMLYIETLRAVCKPTGQIPLNTITMLNYPGELTPTGEWTLMGPGRVKVTTWINLSRAPRILGYYYSSACNPEQEQSDRVPYATSRAIKELADTVFRPYGPMITNLEVAPRRIAVLSSAAARVHSTSPNLAGGYANMQVYHFYSVMAMAHLQADVVFDETVERFGLDDYDVLVLPKCDVLTKTVYDEVLRFAARGGRIIADQYLGPKVPGAIAFDFDFTYRARVSAKAVADNLAYAEWNDQLQPESAKLQEVKGVTALDDQRIMESYAARLKAGLAGVVEPEVDCDQPTVLFNMLESGPVKYLAVVNDKRVYDERVGKYKGVLGELVPQSVSIRLRDWAHPGLVAYDMLERKALDVVRGDGDWRFDVSLSSVGGTFVALYPGPLATLAIQAPAAVKPGVTYDFAILVGDANGQICQGLQPIEITIADPDGASNASSGYYCAKDGVLHVRFTPALNDTRGTWTFAARDLTAGLSATHTFDLRE